MGVKKGKSRPKTMPTYRKWKLWHLMASKNIACIWPSAKKYKYPKSTWHLCTTLFSKLLCTYHQGQYFPTLCFCLPLLPEIAYVYGALANKVANEHYDMPCFHDMSFSLHN